MRTEKIGLEKFLHSKKMLKFEFPKCLFELLSAKEALIECQTYTSKKN